MLAAARNHFPRTLAIILAIMLAVTGVALFIAHRVQADVSSVTASGSTAPRVAPAPAPQPTAPPIASGAFPTAKTAGLPAGWQPKSQQTGDLWIRQTGAVVEDLHISNGTIFVAAENVTLRRIEGANVRVFNFPGASCSKGLVVENSTFHGGRSISEAVIGDGGFTVRNVVIDGAPEGLRAGYSSECGGVTVENTFIRIAPPSPCGDWHGDGIQGYGGGHLVVRNSVIDLDEINGCYGTAPFFYPSGQGNTSVDIDGLVVSGGGFPIRLGMGGKVTGLHVVDRSWGYGSHEVTCSVLSSWQAQISRLDSAGQPVPVRTLACR